MRPNQGRTDHDRTSRAELIRDTTGPACVRLWASVVLLVLADIEAGLRVLRAGPTTDLAVVSGRSERIKDARKAAAWLFGTAARRDRAWICGWLGIEPERLQEAVRRRHGRAMERLLALI